MNQNALTTLAMYTPLLAGFQTERGYQNMEGIHPQAIIPTTTGNVSARSYFHAIEHVRRKMTPVERDAFIKSLNPHFLRAFAIEMPFLLEYDIPNIHGTAVEVWMKSSRYICYLENIDLSHKVFQFIEIPNDASDPEIHISRSALVLPALETLR